MLRSLKCEYGANLTIVEGIISETRQKFDISPVETLVTLEVFMPYFPVAVRT